MEQWNQVKVRVYTANQGYTFQIEVGDKNLSPIHREDDKIKIYRLGVCAILTYLKNNIKDKDLTFIEKTKKKWGYHRLDYEDTIKFLCQNSPNPQKK